MDSIEKEPNETCPGCCGFPPPNAPLTEAEIEAGNYDEDDEEHAPRPQIDPALAAKLMEENRACFERSLEDDDEPR